MLKKHRNLKNLLWRYLFLCIHRRQIFRIVWSACWRRRLASGHGRGRPPRAENRRGRLGVPLERFSSTECARDRDLHWLLPMRISNHKIFGLHPKVMLPQHIYACNFVVITLVCPTKVGIMKLKCNLLSRMWQHDFLMKQIFFSLIFLSENKGQLAKQAGYPGHNPWYTR